MRDSEEEKLAYSGMSQPLQDKMQAAPASLAGQVGPPAPRIQEFVNFKMPKDIALVSNIVIFATTQLIGLTRICVII